MPDVWFCGPVCGVTLPRLKKAEEERLRDAEKAEKREKKEKKEKEKEKKDKKDKK